MLTIGMMALSWTQQTTVRRMYVEDAQDVVDRAFTAFVAAHKVELGIFRSVEWATVLAAAEETRYNEPIVLLARAPIHLSNRQVVEDGARCKL